ncbi:MAG TPA: ABC transporter substrate-binding protein [Stellaceae bacterium]|nr:ABC transporter substrate-binding protein [Stellaceae bacterium]
MRQIAALLLLTLCAVAPAFAQNTEKLPIVGVLRMNTPETAQLPVTGLKAALAALGRVDGRNIRLDVRLAGGHIERLPELAEALVREKASVILATGLPAILAAQRATRTIPIVADDDDLLAEGVIGSLAKPGGNTTGISILATELDAKRLEILKQIRPAARRIALLRDPSNSAPARVQPVADTARALGVELQAVDVHSPADLAPAFGSFLAAGAEAVNILASPVLFSFREQLVPLSLDQKLPAMCQWRAMAEAGCLASYGPTLRELAAMRAALADKMLTRARPGETPAQQPIRLELVINQRTAHAIGVEIPQAILGRADEVIE